MTFDFKKLVAEATARGLRFLLIGGYAVNAHGYSRKTFDIDFLICANCCARWITIVLTSRRLSCNSKRYREFHPWT